MTHMFALDEFGGKLERAACGDELADDDGLTEIAVVSDCENCRAVYLIGPPKQAGLKTEPVWEPSPMEDADAICEAVRMMNEVIPPSDAGTFDFSDEDGDETNGVPLDDELVGDEES